ncbi:hypothetical protein FACS1894120_5620 [Clostridia bacterium]|nr:hypothetical protein FACS1894120_5620 [Clostridia bacterium]
MVETVCRASLPVDEDLIIKKARLVPADYDKRLHEGKLPRFSLVTGVHGDELEGQYICYELIRRLKNNTLKLGGIVDVYPAINPIGIDSITRTAPVVQLDMGGMFGGGGGDGTSNIYDYVAQAVAEDIKGSSLCIEIGSGDILLREIPQARVYPKHRSAVLDFAKKLNTDFIWIGDTPSVAPTSLSYQLNECGTPAFACTMGTGLRITKGYADQIIDGIFEILKELDIWRGEVLPVSNPIISTDGEVSSLYADRSGVFIPCAEHWVDVQKDEKIGDILNPFTGETECAVLSKAAGMIFTLREYPIVSEGSMLARVLATAPVSNMNAGAQLDL